MSIPAYLTGHLARAIRGVKDRGLDRWLVPYLTTRRPRPPADAPVHLLLCVADHFEPKRGGPPEAVAARRVRDWVGGYPRLFDRFRDSDGKPPRHSFFYPVEEYEPRYLDDLAALCRAGFGEVEVHLHHDRDHAENLRRTLTGFKELLAGRHGLLARDRETDAVRYGFIHGNWALDNGRPDGRWCGVNNELDVLRETGCYADFTLPSYPSPTQTRTINSIYYAVDDPHRPRSHDTGVKVGVGSRPENSLMLIQGPLVLDWRRSRLRPRVENGCIQGNQPPTDDRIDAWLRAGVVVPTRPDWSFVKLHTHGAEEANQRVLLGEPMTRFHEALARRAEADPRFHYHYVTAREMYNLACAAEAGWTGDVAGARDFRLTCTWQVAPRPAAGPATKRSSLAGAGV
ncbi:MAG: hypothetical protein U0790_05020 [Isosphaeraceae bacterium]